jgi:hypothetical protein
VNCLSCHAEVTNGLALCELCQRYASTCLDVLPVYFANLARWRPGRAGSRPVPGSRVLYDGPTRTDGTGDRISDRLDETITALTTWARALIEDRPHFVRPLTLADAVLADDLPPEVADDLNDDPASKVRLLCAGFEKHLTSLATLGWAGDFVAQLSQHEATLSELTEELMPGWYAGACRQCGYATHVIPGLTWVKCGHCGTTTYARDHLETILDEARQWVAPPKRIAEAVVALVDTELSVPRLYERIKKWEQREKIPSIQRIERGYEWSDDEDRMVVADQAVGAKRYRLGDVLDRVYAEGATRVGGGKDRGRVAS